MNASFGIDHPLLATNDIEGLRKRLISLGFNMTAIGRHPWGTSTSLAMFNGCLIEIMGIYDEALLDEVPSGNFRFGRHVYEHLQIREGVALSALHSTDSIADARKAGAAGFTVAGHLEFGRNVILPDGTEGRTKTTLALLPDEKFPRLSLFLCQQHRPELIYVPEWLEHPNKVIGICGVNILADNQFHAELKAQFEGIYKNCNWINGGFQCQTANGTIRILEIDTFEQVIGPLPDGLRKDNSPCIAGMDLVMSDPNMMHEFLKKSNIEFRIIENGFTLTNPSLTANTILRMFNK